MVAKRLTGSILDNGPVGAAEEVAIVGEIVDEIVAEIVVSIKHQLWWPATWILPRKNLSARWRIGSRGTGT